MYSVKCHFSNFFHTVHLIKGFKIHKTKLSATLTRLFSKPHHSLCLTLSAGSTKFVSSCHALFCSFAGSAVLADLLRNGSVPFKESSDTFVSLYISSFQMEQKKSPLCSLLLYYGRSSDPCQADYSKSESPLLARALAHL